MDELNRAIAKANIEVKKGRGHHNPTVVRLRDEVRELVRRWMDYEEKLKTMGEGRNSFSKTDPDETFMHMKEDHMRNGQLKPGYNVQFVVNSEYITGIGVFSARTDYATLPIMLKTMEEWQQERYKKVCLDSGYESLVNYRYLAKNSQLAYIKPNNYEAMKKKTFKAQIGRREKHGILRTGGLFPMQGWKDAGTDFNNNRKGKRRY